MFGRSQNPALVQTWTTLMQTWEKNNSILTRVKQQNPSVYFNECQFHAVHNTSSAAAKAFNAGTGFDVDYLLVEIYYWSVHSTKRKCKLEEYTDFCEQGYRKIIKHVSTRWLSPLLDSRGSKPPTKRKCKLEEYTDFCEQGYRKIIKHVSTRWLSPLLDSRGSKPPSATP